MDTLPLFPLGTVMLPGTLLPLHVFEPRYVTLMRAIEPVQGGFGLIGIRRGREVGDPYRLTAAILDGLGQPAPQLQEVLESGGTARRLRVVTAMCKREQQLAEVLDCRAARVTPPSRLSPN